MEVGAPIITIGSTDAAAPAPAAPVSVPEPSDPGGAVLVGYGTGGRCRRVAASPPSAP